MKACFASTCITTTINGEIEIDCRLADPRALTLVKRFRFGFKVRDDFSQSTIEEIAKGVCYQCSNPSCGRATVAVNAAQDGIVVLAVAVHICAASPMRPRYNPAQTRDQRRGKKNGIWLCQNCGRLFDADPDNYPVEKLQEGKRTTQERACCELVALVGRSSNAEAARIGSLAASDDRKEEGASPGDVVAKFRSAARWPCEVHA